MTTLHTFRRLFLGEITKAGAEVCGHGDRGNQQAEYPFSGSIVPYSCRAEAVEAASGSSSHDQTSLTPLTTPPPPAGSSGREDKAPEPDKLKLNVAKGICHHPRPVNTANKRLLKIPHFGTMVTRSLSLQAYFKFESLLLIVK